MATKYWVGPNGQSCSFSSSANWSTSPGGAGGSSISSTDDLVIAGSYSIIDSGLSNGSLTPNSLTIRGGGVTIGGSAGTSLTLAGITTNLVLADSGQYIKINPGTVGGTLDVAIDNPGSNTEVYLTGGTITGATYLGFGGAFIASGCTLALVRSCGCAVVLNGDVTATDVEAHRASATIKCDIDSLRVSGDGGIGIIQNGADAGTITNLGCRMTFIDPGTITLLDARAGSRNTSKGSSATFTITDCTQEAGAYVFDGDQIQPTITNAKRLVGYGV